MTAVKEIIKNKREVVQIFNLEFPSYVEELKIDNYTFKKDKKYSVAFSKMMHLVNSFGSEYDTQAQTGSHQITSMVSLPVKEKRSALAFGDKSSTQLEDILFLLSLFTGRNIFKKNWDNDKEKPIISDHRIYQYGGQLICSIKFESKWKNRITGEIKSDKQMESISTIDYNQYDIGFEKTLNKVLKLITSKKWQKEYEGGYFLFLYKSASQRQIIETSFITCWTIWEHIFAIKNRKWLDNKSMEQMSGDKKISFILNEYFFKDIDAKARKNIQKINKTRNRLVHFGKKTEQIDYKDMELFIRLTEQLIAKILNLPPSNIFNSSEKLDSFLNSK